MPRQHPADASSSFAEEFSVVLLVEFGNDQIPETATADKVISSKRAMAERQSLVMTKLQAVRVAKAAKAI